MMKKPMQRNKKANVAILPNLSQRNLDTTLLGQWDLSKPRIMTKKKAQKNKITSHACPL